MAAVSAALRSAQLSLRSASTAPLDFTLHDEGHSFRVAENIFSLIPKDVDLNAYELALLLLSSYIHDIGMSPSQYIVNLHYNYLITGAKESLTNQQIRDFQQWIDAEYWGISVPIAVDKLSSSDLRLVDEIISYYSRHKHNDWSEEWARSVLGDLPDSLYANWVDDTVTLCRSHHEGLAALRSDRFDAKLVGSRGQAVNLRYLAALLRIADVVEFDPERTPSVILERRDIAANSRIYWMRDHQIAFHLNAEDSSISLSARTPNAPLHRAVLDIVQSVNHELAVCAALEHEGLFVKGKIPSQQRSRYRWGWPSQIGVDIAEKDGSFVYIEGAFRPDTKRVLNLLSGVALYGNPLAAVRELLQNAVDAVKEQIAYERLGQEDCGCTDFSEIWSQVHHIKLSIEEEAGDIWLRCSDDGIGMTRDIIENHLLVSGSPPRVASRTLDREAAERGFSVGRTGQFGVGALSYFMIADRLEITTRQSAEAGDIDHSGWRFISEGLGTFGELMPASRSTKGTEVRLRLRRDAFDSAQSVFTQISEYISKTVSFLPCKLEFKDNIGEESPLVLQAGWAFPAAKFSSSCLPPVYASRPPADASSARIKQAEMEFEERQRMRGDALTRLKWLGPEEIVLGDPKVRVRVWLPYFELEHGNCAVYMDIDGSTLAWLPSGDHFLRAEKCLKVSWRGFGVHESPLDIHDRVLAQVDVSDGGIISVARESLTFRTDECSKFIAEAAQRLRERFLRENDTSPFKFVSSSILKMSGKRNDGQLHWRDNNNQWSVLAPPFAQVLRFVYDRELTGGETTNAGRSVQRLFELTSGSTPTRISDNINGGRIVYTRDHSKFSILQTAILWDEHPTEFTWGPRKFPPSLAQLVALSVDGKIELNGDHPFAAGASPYGYPSFGALDEHCADELLRSTVIKNLCWYSLESWSSLGERYPILKRRIMDAIGNTLDSRIDAWVVSGADEFVYTLDDTGIHYRKQPFSFEYLEAYDGRIFKIDEEEDHWIIIKDSKAEGSVKKAVTGTVTF
ncbi:HD domain-containing protein [Neoaquamicrobium microcysteis]|nr:ATP-binding protein [Mesorhizobium microcysteis]